MCLTNTEGEVSAVRQLLISTEEVVADKSHSQRQRRRD